MDTFTATINGWHDFYIMIGTAAATLVGLLFVSLSINANVIIKPEHADLRALAEQTFTIFLDVLSFAVFFLIPGQDKLGLGLPLLAIGGYGLYNITRHLLDTRPAKPRLWIRGRITRRYIVPLVCFVVLLIIAVTVLMGSTNGLYWLIPVMIMLIITASINAWDLLLRLYEPKEVKQ